MLFTGKENVQIDPSFPRLEIDSRQTFGSISTYLVSSQNTTQFQPIQEEGDARRLGVNITRRTNTRPQMDLHGPDCPKNSHPPLVERQDRDRSRKLALADISRGNNATAAHVGLSPSGRTNERTCERASERANERTL